TAQKALAQIFGSETADMATRPEASGGAPLQPDGENAAEPDGTPELPDDAVAGDDDAKDDDAADSAASLAPAPTGDRKAAVESIDRAIRRLKSAQTSADFAEYGKALEEVDEAVGEYEIVTGNAGGCQAGSRGGTGR